MSEQSNSEREAQIRADVNEGCTVFARDRIITILAQLDAERAKVKTLRELVKQCVPHVAHAAVSAHEERRHGAATKHEQFYVELNAALAATEDKASQ